jgi:hypothetical protein
MDIIPPTRLRTIALCLNSHNISFVQLSDEVMVVVGMRIEAT